MSRELMEIIVECEDGTDPRCINNDGLLTIAVEKNGLTDDQIIMLREEQDENGFVSQETLEEIREFIDDDEWATETICSYCKSDSIFDD
ncbi:hypothetical protein [Desulforhopalus sp. IMCC35007]|uniref:hypothetical protein n=1 Tax=Desulforhopalus sp. IMCC35007 TaxID=2569543 RepID=UPI0010AED789|nr:hypothetical protein [Desulforhopalus sp. IMCC35007]TKB09718.1 hypothetical protein FCL48_09730 [Desulforhopalus sp. IMCC35007]